MANVRHGSGGDTRGRILALLCAGSLRVSELAQALGISANGVRGQLAQLEAEGLVEYTVVRRGVGKPAHEYRLTPGGSARLSRAYLPLLHGMLTLMSEGGNQAKSEALLRQVGRRLAREFPKPAGTLRERTEAAVQLLGELGGISLVREEEGVLRIEGVCCPLGALVGDHPVVCKAVEALVEECVGAPVREQCDKVDQPACRMVVAAASREEKQTAR